MTKPNAVPSQEPKIKVGIVLPEDKQTAISMRTPADKKYVLKFADGEEEIPAGTLLNILVENGLRS